VSAADTARRLVEDVQRLGLSSASAVVQRYAVAVERTLGAAPPVGGDGLPDPGTLVDTTARMARAYLDLLDGLAGLVGRGPAGTMETVDLPASRPGGTGEVPVWVHNGTADSVEVAVRPGPLVSADGVALPAAAVTVTPSSVTVPARGRAELRLRVDVPDAQPAGTYFGFALSTAAAPVALRLDVVDEDPAA
jgi:hypothetical protein